MRLLARLTLSLFIGLTLFFSLLPLTGGNLGFEWLALLASGKVFLLCAGWY